jgi:hypothetical protein
MTPATTDQHLATVGLVLAKQKWQFAKTMRWIPHYYTVQRWWNPESELSHREILKALSQQGVLMSWGKKKVLRHYLDFVDPSTGIEWRYWHMGECTHEGWMQEDLDVINRQEISLSTCVLHVESPPDPQQPVLF